MSNKELEMKAREHDLSDISADPVVEMTETAAKETVSGYKKIEQGVVNGYKKIEDGVVGGFNKVVDKCVEVLFAKEGESVEDAKARLNGKDKE